MGGPELHEGLSPIVLAYSRISISLNCKFASRLQRVSSYFLCSDSSAVTNFIIGLTCKRPDKKFGALRLRDAPAELLLGAGTASDFERAFLRNIVKVELSLQAAVRSWLSMR